VCVIRHSSAEKGGCFGFVLFFKKTLILALSAGNVTQPRENLLIESKTKLSCPDVTLSLCLKLPGSVSVCLETCSVCL
jgi:hypothetical protein